MVLHYYNQGGITVLQNAKVGPRLHPAYIILTSVHLLKVWIGVEILRALRFQFSSSRLAAGSLYAVNLQFGD